MANLETFELKAPTDDLAFAVLRIVKWPAFEMKPN